MSEFEWCTDCKEYDHEKHCCPRWNKVIRTTLNDSINAVLDEIREEIVNKAESGQWSEAVKYGMLKAILIIDKHRKENAESEAENGAGD